MTASFVHGLGSSHAHWDSTIIRADDEEHNYRLADTVHIIGTLGTFKSRL